MVSAVGGFGSGALSQPRDILAAEAVHQDWKRFCPSPTLRVSVCILAGFAGVVEIADPSHREERQDYIRSEIEPSERVRTTEVCRPRHGRVIV